MTNTVIKINNKDYLLAFDINTLCLMDANGFDVMNLDNEAFTISTFRELFYYALMRYYKKDLTLEKAGEIMSEFLEEGGDMAEMTEKITTALTKAMGQSNSDKGK
jgi:hypothetical protein